VNALKKGVQATLFERLAASLGDLNSPPARIVQLTRISQRLTGQAHERPAITLLRLLAVLNGL